MMTMTDKGDTTRAAYAGELILSSKRTESMDTWSSGLNNNLLVLESSESGKTRNFLKPNILQCEGSYVVLDSKGRLYHEMAPFLRSHGYTVDCLDFTTMGGTLGYDPLHHVRWRKGRPLEQDIIAIASALFPRSDMGNDLFWASAAANYVASYIAYVFDALPENEWNMSSVVKVYEQACEGYAEALFANLSKHDPDSYAISLYRRAKSTARAEKMHASIMGIIAANMMPLAFNSALASFCRKEQIDFRDLGREKRALFVTMDDKPDILCVAEPSRLYRAYRPAGGKPPGESLAQGTCRDREPRMRLYLGGSPQQERGARHSCRQGLRRGTQRNGRPQEPVGRRASAQRPADRKGADHADGFARRGPARSRSRACRHHGTGVLPHPRSVPARWIPLGFSRRNA